MYKVYDLPPPLVLAGNICILNDHTTIQSTDMHPKLYGMHVVIFEIRWIIGKNAEPLTHCVRVRGSFNKLRQLLSVGIADHCVWGRFSFIRARQ